LEEVTPWGKDQADIQSFGVVVASTLVVAVNLRVRFYQFFLTLIFFFSDKRDRFVYLVYEINHVLCIVVKGGSEQNHNRYLHLPEVQVLLYF
jgi:hypothetical protein